MGTTMRPGDGLVLVMEEEMVVDSIDGLIELFGCVIQ